MDEKAIAIKTKESDEVLSDKRASLISNAVVKLSASENVDMTELLHSIPEYV